ncbi:cytosolic factor, phosphatidylinositol/phosphatidylcholine transfer protein [Nowakowskiella sp. JEL0078]|nr:cytosolic factor, phosphatidylinositol/phosphatidylcholine transfer protein [Nowakowskiella sp. JEL0078]
MSRQSLNLPGRLDTLSEQQLDVLNQFKSHLKELSKENKEKIAAGTTIPEITETITDSDNENAPPFFFDSVRHHDHLFLRFLRARKFDLIHSLKMFLDYEAWRSTFNGQGVDTIVKNWEFPEMPIISTYYPRFYHKTDKFGRPVYIELLGIMNLDQILAVSTLERCLIQHVVEYEKLVNYRLPACSENAGYRIEQSCTIIDLKGISLSSVSRCFSFVQKVSAVAQNYYPEMLGRMFIINAPMLFTAVWQLVKPLLDEVTVNKISILGGSYTKNLLEVIDDVNLPTMFGGKSTDTNDIGPWNDGTVGGYPKTEYEQLLDGFGLEVGPKAKISL